MPEEKIYAGMIGCGSISHEYLKTLRGKFRNVEVIMCSSRTKESAERAAKQYGIRAVTTEEMLSSPEIGLVVVLTPASTHYVLAKQALLAGKHVYTEKTMAVTPEEAAELVALAEEKGLYLGSAPDVFLGSALQSIRKAIDEGRIGEVTGFQISCNRNVDLLASAFSFLRMPAGGIGYDFGVYHLTALVSLLGPVDRVAAVVQNPKEVRVNVWKDSPDYGKEYIYPNESQVTAVIQLENGIAGSLMLNGESNGIDRPIFRIYGSKGILEIPDPNEFGADVSCISNTPAGEQTVILDPVSKFTQIYKGTGITEMVDAIFHHRPHKASGARAYHVLDIITTMMKSSESGKFEKVQSTCTRPDVFTEADTLLNE